MTRAQQRFLLAGALVLVSAVAGSAGMGCGKASIDTFQPCTTPVIDITFRTGVMNVLQTHDCNSGTTCHSKDNGGASGLTLGGSGTTPDEIYQNLMTGGALQSSGTDVDVAVGSTAANGLVLLKPLSTSPVSHAGGKQFSSTSEAGYQAIFLWASNGAANNGNPGGCLP